MNGAFRLCARTAARPLDCHTVALLRPAIDMEIIPHLRDLRASVIQQARALGRLVVPRARAAHVRRSAVLGFQRCFEVCEGVGGAVGGRDVVLGQPGEGRQAGVVHDRRLEEVDDFLVLAVMRAVAGDVEGGEAGRVLGELVLERQSVSPACRFCWHDCQIRDDRV